MSKKILLADDSITIHKVISITFGEEDFALEMVSDGDAAIAKAREIVPDLIMADVSMPGKSGYEVCAAVKGDPQLSHIPFLILAGTFEPINDEELRRVGADDFIVKPFESQELIDKVHDLLIAGGAPPRETEGVEAPMESAASSPEEPSAEETPAAPSVVWDEGDFINATGAEGAERSMEQPSEETLTGGEEALGDFGEPPREAAGEAEFTDFDLGKEEGGTFDNLEEIDEIEVIDEWVDLGEGDKAGAAPSGEPVITEPAAPAPPAPELDREFESFDIPEEQEERPIGFESGPALTTPDKIEDEIDVTSSEAVESDKGASEEMPVWPVESEPEEGTPAEFEPVSSREGLQGGGEEPGTPSTEEETTSFDVPLPDFEASGPEPPDLAEPGFEPPAEFAEEAPGEKADIPAIEKEKLEEIVSRVARGVLEEVAWEVVPEMVEDLIKEEIRKTKEALTKTK